MIAKKENKNIILVRPPSPLGQFAIVNMQHPINLLILGSIAENLGYKTFIYDFEIEGIDLNKFINFVRKISPIIVGFSFTTPQAPFCNASAGLVKSINLETITIAGGAHISALPKETMIEFPNFDIGFVGEADRSFSVFLKSLASGKEWNEINGIIYRKNGEIVYNNLQTRLDIIPDFIPARHLLDIERYNRLNRFKSVAAPGVFKPNLRATQMFTSRGCIFNCIFCSNTSNFGPENKRPKIVSRDISGIKEEIRQITDKFKINHISIQDELFPASRRLFYEFCDIAREFSITFNCNSRTDLLKFDDYKIMKESGCLQIGFGIESGSQRIINLIGKNVDINQIYNAFDYAHRTGIRTVGYFLVGSHPEETEEDILETIKFIKEIRPDLITCTLAVPYPGTVLRDILLQNGLIYSNQWEYYAYYSKRPVWRTFFFSSDMLLKMQLKILSSFYLSLNYIKHRLQLIDSYQELFMLAQGGMRMSRFFINKIKSSSRNIFPNWSV